MSILGFYVVTSRATHIVGTLLPACLPHQSSLWMASLKLPGAGLILSVLLPHRLLTLSFFPCRVALDQCDIFTSWVNHQRVDDRFQLTRVALRTRMAREAAP